MNAFFDKKLLERVGFAEREDLVKVPPTETPPAPAASEVADDQPEAKDSSVITTEAELEVYDHVRHRLPFLIHRDEDLFRKLEHVYFKDFKGVFAVCYKQDRKGRLFNFREGGDTKYRFEFAESGETITTDDCGTTLWRLRRPPYSSRKWHHRGGCKEPLLAGGKNRKPEDLVGLLHSP